MLNIDLEEMVAGLQKAIPGLEKEQAVGRARDLIDNTDCRLEKNVKEWLEGQTISDVWVDKYCINAILAIRKDRDFLSALDAMNFYLKDPKAGELRIWRVRR